MDVSTWSIRNPIPSILLFIMLTILGLMSFRSMKVQNFPDIDLPLIIVTAELPGAAPAQLETEVARKIENSIATLQQVKHIYTRVQDGTATITTEFRLEKPTQQALDDVRYAVARIRSDLPGDLRDPLITKMELSGAPILIYTVSSSRMDDEALAWFIDNDVVKSMLSVRGVGAVSRVGGATREVRVELDPTRLLALNATASDVSRRLRSIQQEASGGRVNVGGSEQSVRTIATVQSAEELARLEISLADGRRVRLSDIATVRDTVAEQRSAALLNGKPVVAFEIVRSRGAGEVEVAAGVRARIARLEADHPDIKTTEAFNLVDPVVENFNGSKLLLYEGAVLAVLVVFIFLRDWRATLISATALPLSVIPAFWVMDLMGFTINVVTLLSLSLVVGMLVDDAIVEIENIMRHLRMGKAPIDAARDAASEIGLAVVATSITVIAVFLPTAFMSGVPGKFFVQFGWTAAIAVFFSLVVARLLTPMLAAHILRPPTQPHREASWLRHYMSIVQCCLRHRGATLLASLAFSILALTPLLLGMIPGAFAPPNDLSQTQVTLSLPPGSSLKQTLVAAELARSILEQDADVKLIFTSVGGRTGSQLEVSGVPEVREASLAIRLTPRGERGGVTKQAIEERLRAALAEVPGARVRVGIDDSSEKHVLVLAGDDGRVLLEHAGKVERELRTVPGIGAVISSARLTRPELIIRPDPARAADLGVTAAAIADTLRIATAGDYEQELAKLNLSQRQLPVVVRLPADARADLELLSRLPVPGARGSVPLANVATLAIESGPAQIDRFDRQRNINFEIELNGRPLGEVSERVNALPSVVSLPAGVFQQQGGDAEAFSELASSFLLAILTGVACIYIVLVLLFRAWAQPVTILGALVLAIPGAMLALFITGQSLSMPSMIGLLMLMGIATKNSILLVEYAIMARRDLSASPMDALLDACQKRARPIVMTTIAMGAGMLPVALGLGVDPSFRAPMAIVVIGGLITSTLLSLLVIPVVYALLDGGLRKGADADRSSGVA